MICGGPGVGGSISISSGGLFSTLRRVSVCLNVIGSSYSELPLPESLCSLSEVEGALNLLVVLVGPDWGALEPLAVELVGFVSPGVSRGVRPTLFPLLATVLLITPGQGCAILRNKSCRPKRSLCLVSPVSAPIIQVLALCLTESRSCCLMVKCNHLQPLLKRLSLALRASSR